MSHPSLRFTTFVDNGSDWKTVQLSEVATYITTRKSVESDSLYVGTDNLIKNFGGLDKSTKKSITGISFEKNDILLSNIRPYLKKLWISDESGICSADVLVIRSKTIEPVFFKYLLSTDEFFNHIAKGYQGSKMPRGDKKQIATFKFSMPSSYKEQQKIAAFFTVLDEKIHLSQLKLDLFEKLKSGVMQKLFSQEYRFKKKDGSPFEPWKSLTVGDLAQVVGGGTPSTLNPDYWDGDIYWLTPTEINSKYVHASNRKITLNGLNNSSAKLLPKGAILLTTRATLGACSINNQDNPVCTNQGFQSLVCKNFVDNEFLYYVITEKAFQKLLIKNASGSTFQEISSKNLKSISVHLPSIDEQRQIVLLLSTIDQKIDCVKRSLKALKAQKTAFMQQMFV